MGATIKDIAKMVGVSTSTVSRVINGNTAISQQTRDKIQEAMKELNYHPNSRARNFANGITNTIALVIDAENETTFANSFFNRSVYAIERTAQSRGYNLLITNDRDEHGTSVSTLVYEKKVDGLILPSSSVRQKLIDLLNQEQFPYVVYGGSEFALEPFSWVDVNNLEGSKKAVQHLWNQGYRKIAFAFDGNVTVFSSNRINGYRDALIECDKNTAPIILNCGRNPENMFDNVTQAVRDKKVDAILCSDNIIAYHILKKTREVGISVPEQFGIVTFDNYPLAEYMIPPLTVVDVDTYQLGKKSADILFGIISGEVTEKKIELIDTELIIRDSSKRKKEE
ncbi:MAG: LacI family DNA-binding transcriptional regulator [Oliverpabstia sp.]